MTSRTIWVGREAGGDAVLAASAGRDGTDKEKTMAGVVPAEKAGQKVISVLSFSTGPCEGEKAQRIDEDGVGPEASPRRPEDGVSSRN